MPTRELLAYVLRSAIADPDPLEQKWNDRRFWYLCALGARREPLVFETVAGWCRSDSWVRQALGASVLKRVGWGKKRSRARALRLLRPMLCSPHWAVVAATVRAVSNLGLDDDLDSIVGLAAHKSSRVRMEVASALGGWTRRSPVIDTLIELSKDRSGPVRDWATFGLGELCEVDTPAVRRALWARAHDPHRDTRDEARLGLAKRGDRRVVPLIRRSLCDDSVSRLPVEAAAALATPELLPALKRLRSWWDLVPETLEEAIRKCSRTRHVGRRP